MTIANRYGGEPQEVRLASGPSTSEGTSTSGLSAAAGGLGGLMRNVAQAMGSAPPAPNVVAPSNGEPIPQFPPSKPAAASVATAASVSSPAPSQGSRYDQAWSCCICCVIFI